MAATDTTVYDIQSNTVIYRIPATEARRDLDMHRDHSATVHEYDTTDRTGTPHHLAITVDAPRHGCVPDQGAVYETPGTPAAPKTTATGDSPQEALTANVTSRPEHPGYDSPEDDFILLIDGHQIGGTYWCPVGERIRAGKQYVSYGPAGYSFGHPTREDAEQAQLDACGLTNATVATEAGPAPSRNRPPLPLTWEQALAEAKTKGVGRCSDHAAMAAFCDASIMHAVGAVSPQLIWEGAMRKDMTLLELGRLAGRDPYACSELMWV
jgi:hypothetical protein